MKEVFADTNVFIDLLTEREPFYKDASILFSRAQAGRIEIYISALTIATANYLLAKEIGATPARRLLSRFTPITKIVALDDSILQQALSDLSFPDAEDAMQYYSALVCGAPLLITRNPKHFKAASIPVVSPARALSILK
jgi:predicted nucleic acid-binding protein